MPLFSCLFERKSLSGLPLPPPLAGSIDRYYQSMRGTYLSTGSLLSTLVAEMQPINLQKEEIDPSDCKYLLEKVLHYEIIDKLGSGCFGMVFDVKSEASEESLACKVFPFGTNSYQKSFEMRFESFAGDLQLANISHRNIVQYKTCFQLYSHKGNIKVDKLVRVINDSTKMNDPNYHLILCGVVLEKLDITLEEWIDKHNLKNALPEKHLKLIFFQVGLALNHLHRVHYMTNNDIKVDNIVLVQDLGPKRCPKLKIIDFGLAKTHTKKMYEQRKILIKSGAQSSENPFVKEIKRFGLMLQELASTGQTKFKDDKFKMIIHKLADPHSQVTLGWALRTFIETNQ